MAETNVSIVLRAKNLASSVMKQFMGDIQQVSKEQEELSRLTVEFSRKLGDRNKMLASGKTLARSMAEHEQQFRESVRQLNEEIRRNSSESRTAEQATKGLGNAAKGASQAFSDTAKSGTSFTNFMSRARQLMTSFGGGAQMSGLLQQGQSVAQFASVFGGNMAKAGTATTEAAGAASAATGAFAGLGAALSAVAIAVAAVVVGIGAFIAGVFKGSQAAQSLQTQLIGLQTAANNFGISTDQVNGAIQRLTADGLLNQADATQALTNLFQSYVTNVDDAVKIIGMYKDFAASGGDAALSFGDKVKQLTESHLTEMSILGNRAGLQENWNQIIKVGEQVTGLQYEKVSKLNQEMIKMAGITAVHARAQGAANMMSETYVGTIQRMRTSMANMGLELSKALLPAAATLSKTFMESTNGGQVIIQVFRGVGVAALALASILRGLAMIVVQTFRAFGAAMSLNFKEIPKIIGDGFNKGKEIIKDFARDSQKIWKGDIAPAMKGVSAGIPKWAEQAANDAGKAYAKMLEDIKKANEKYQRDLDNMSKDFNRTLADMVFAHRHKIDDIKEQMRDETKEFEKQNADKLQDYLRTLLKMESAHLRKVRDLNQDLGDEDDRYAEARGKILDEIQKEERKGIYLFGVWNSQADADRLAELRQRLADEDAEHARRVRDIRQNLDDENTDYAASVEEKNQSYQEDVANAKEAYLAKNEELQKQLDEEEGLLRKHGDLVASIKDMQEEDEFQRLVRTYNEQKTERERAFNEEIQGIQEKAKEAGSGVGSGYTEGLNAGIGAGMEQFNTDVGELTDEFATQQEETHKSAIENLTESWNAFWGFLTTNVPQWTATIGENVRMWTQQMKDSLSTKLNEMGFDADYFFKASFPEKVGYLAGWLSVKIPEMGEKMHNDFNYWLTETGKKWETFKENIGKWMGEMATKIADKKDEIVESLKQLQKDAKNWLEDLPDSLKNVATRVGNWIKDTWDKVKNSIQDAISKFEEGFKKGVVNAGGQSRQHGGIVTGPYEGAPVPIMAHAGERVVPRTGVDVNGGGSGISINMYGAVSMRSEADIRALANEIVSIIGRRNELERLGVGVG